MKAKYIQPEISILKAYGKEFIMQNGVVTGSQKYRSKDLSTRDIEKLEKFGRQLRGYDAIRMSIRQIDERCIDEDGTPYLLDRHKRAIEQLLLDANKNDFPNTTELSAKIYTITEKALQEHRDRLLKKMRESSK